MKEFVVENFYKTAPVPTALELFKERKMSDYLEDELNLRCNTGVSFGCHDDKITDAVSAPFC